MVEGRGNNIPGMQGADNLVVRGSISVTPAGRVIIGFLWVCCI